MNKIRIVDEDYIPYLQKRGIEERDIEVTKEELDGKLILWGNNNFYQEGGDMTGKKILKKLLKEKGLCPVKMSHTHRKESIGFGETVNRAVPSAKKTVEDDKILLKVKNNNRTANILVEVEQ